MEKTTRTGKIIKPKIIFTRVCNTNDKYLNKIKHCVKSHTGKKTSRATCLDDMLSFLRESVSDQTIINEIAKRRNKVWKESKPVSGYSS